MSDEKLTKEEILSLPWVEAPEKRHTKQPGFGSIPFTPANLPNSGFRWTDDEPKRQPALRVVQVQPQVQPTAVPKIEQPVGVPSAFELIPYVEYLVGSNFTMLDPSSLELVETFNRVFLCRFKMVARPDPMLPIAGFYWPKVTKEQSQTWEVWRQFRHAYNVAAGALAQHKRSWFRQDMAYATNTILQICARVPDTHMTQSEYRFVAAHLTTAMKNPEKYT